MVFAPAAFAQDSTEKESASALFERALTVEGLDVALERLNAALADTSGRYEIDGYELVIKLPAQLVLRHQRLEALELIKAMQGIFGDDPRGWLELGYAHIRCGNTAEAREALEKARKYSQDRADIVWMAEHLDELIANAKRKAECEDELLAGESTGLVGPYLGQTPPGVTPEVWPR